MQIKKEEILINTKTSKIKNKKKDVILADNIQDKSHNPYASNPQDQNKNQTQNKNPSEKEKIKIINPLLEEDNQIRNPQQKQEDIKKEENNNNRNNKKEYNHNFTEREKSSTEKNSKIINDVIFNIQLLFSSTKIIPLKIYESFLRFLSMENLKEILEERDCLEICGNIQCNKSLKKAREKKFFFNSKIKEFVKEDVQGYFCDIRCLQKFKDAMRITDSFDFLKFFKLENLFVLHNTKDYFNDEIFAKKISFLIRELYDNSINKASEETIQALRKNLDEYYKEKNNDNDNDNSNYNDNINIKVINNELKEKIDLNK
jgi:hypothetical protein